MNFKIWILKIKKNFKSPYFLIFPIRPPYFEEEMVSWFPCKYVVLAGGSTPKLLGQNQGGSEWGSEGSTGLGWWWARAWGRTVARSEGERDRLRVWRAGFWPWTSRALRWWVGPARGLWRPCTLCLRTETRLQWEAQDMGESQKLTTEQRSDRSRQAQEWGQWGWGQNKRVSVVESWAIWTSGVSAVQTGPWKGPKKCEGEGGSKCRVSRSKAVLMACGAGLGVEWPARHCGDWADGLGTLASRRTETHRDSPPGGMCPLGTDQLAHQPGDVTEPRVGLQSLTNSVLGHWYLREVVCYEHSVSLGSPDGP